MIKSYTRTNRFYGPRIVKAVCCIPIQWSYPKDYALVASRIVRRKTKKDPLVGATATLAWYLFARGRPLVAPTRETFLSFAAQCGYLVGVNLRVDPNCNTAQNGVLVGAFIERPLKRFSPRNMACVSLPFV